jgi:hypothetical protein
VLDVRAAKSNSHFELCAQMGYVEEASICSGVDIHALGAVVESVLK